MTWDGFFASLDRFVRGVHDFFGVSPAALCPLHTVDTDGILVAENGALVSLIRIHGVLRLTGEEEFERTCAVLADALRTPLSRQGHALQVVFSCDPGEASREIRGRMRPLRGSAAALGLDLDGLLEDWARTLSGCCASERIWLAVWTKPRILSRAERAEAAREAASGPRPCARLREAQTGIAVAGRMRDTHRAVAREVLERLRGLSFRAGLLDAHEAVAALRRVNLPEWTSETWRPVLPGDPLPLRAPLPGAEAGEAGTFLPPTLSSQIWAAPARVLEGRFAAVGERIYAPFTMSLPPQTLLPFATLFRSLLAEGLPWRAAFLLTGDGMRGQGLKAAAAAVLSLASSSNRQLTASWRWLQEKVLAGETAVGFQVSFVTWARLSEGRGEAETLRILRGRAARLAGAVQSWGACDTAMLSGDPLLVYTATLPGATPLSPAARAIAPLPDALRLLPLFRPCSPWTTTDVPLRSSDGRFMPLALFHSSQASWNEICFAGMGSGKSFFLNTLNFFYILRAGRTRLPWLTVIDAGRSCAGVMDLVRAALPPERRHLVLFAALRNVRESAVNVFDTPLGAPRPLPGHAGFLTNFLSLLCTPLNESAPSDGVTDLLREAVDAAYARLAPEGEAPRVFDPHAEPAVTRRLREEGFRPDEDTTWWETVRFLFDAGEIPLAVRAQRRAVPLLADLMLAIGSPVIRGRFEDVSVPGSSESLPDACLRHLTSAVREYPILAAPTSFGLGEARVVGLDLGEVTPRGGPAAERQSALMYMLARHCGAGHFFQSPADLDRIPEPYRAWHAPRFADLAASPKRLCYDEFHRASCADMSNPLSRQIIADLTTASREARKQNLSIGLYSQRLDDFPPVLVELATSVYVLGAGSAEETAGVSRRFGFNAAAHAALRRLAKPAREGAGIVGLFRTASGEAIQHLTCTVPPAAAWAFSSTAEDMRLRGRLYERLGCARALACLRRAYPEGTVKEELERRRLRAETGPGGRSVDLEEEILEELTALAERMAGEEERERRLTE